MKCDKKGDAIQGMGLSCMKRVTFRENVIKNSSLDTLFVSGKKSYKLRLD